MTAGDQKMKYCEIKIKIADKLKEVAQMLKDNPDDENQDILIALFQKGLEDNAIGIRLLSSGIDSNRLTVLVMGIIDSLPEEAKIEFISHLAASLNEYTKYLEYEDVSSSVH
ncbi:MAG: hypothetical protein D6732_24260 [Methanobacteriota archaeon]|nr:MAG: hypothetical protein D6732_24260 [Euryarchaeota archaeon]